MIENTITEFFAGSSDVWGSPADLLSHQDADPAFGLSVARGVAAAAMTLANWEPSSALPFGAATSAGMDGTNRSDSGEHRAPLWSTALDRVGLSHAT